MSSIDLGRFHMLVDEHLSARWDHFL